MPSDNSPETRRKETRAINTLREVRGENVFVAGTRDFLHFLLDYNIVAFTISFIVARSALDVISKITPLIIHNMARVFGSKISDIGELGTSLITFGFVLFVCFLFIQFVFQPLITSKQITEERKLREFVKITEKEKIKNEVNGTSSALSFLRSNDNNVL